MSCKKACTVGLFDRSVWEVWIIRMLDLYKYISPTNISILHNKEYSNSVQITDQTFRIFSFFFQSSLSQPTHLIDSCHYFARGQVWGVVGPEREGRCQNEVRQRQVEKAHVRHRLQLYVSEEKPEDCCVSCKKTGGRNTFILDYLSFKDRSAQHAHIY